jgi:hypothetical protein
MSTIERYEVHESVRTLERAMRPLDMPTHRQDLNGEEIDNRFSWQERGNCRGADTDLLFPERGASTLKAKAMCAACMVNLEFALTEVERFGLGGGLPERERRKIRGQRTREEKRA